MQTTLYDVRPYDLHAIFIPDYQFQKVLSNNFFTVFYGGPLVVEALGNCPVCPSLKSGPGGKLNALLIYRS